MTTAARKHGCGAIGCDIDLACVRMARERVTIEEKDLFAVKSKWFEGPLVAGEPFARAWTDGVRGCIISYNTPQSLFHQGNDPCVASCCPTCRRTLRVTADGKRNFVRCSGCGEQVSLDEPEVENPDPPTKTLVSPLAGKNPLPNHPGKPDPRKKKEPGGELPTSKTRTTTGSPPRLRKRRKWRGS